MIRNQLQISDTDFLVMYAGNIGASQGLEVILDVARLLADRDDIHFAIIGGGTMAATLRARADELSLKRVKFLSAVPFEQMPEVQADADASLVLQKANVLDVNLPSKIPAILASGRPIIAAVNPLGDAHRILLESGAARLASPGDAKAIAAAIVEIAADRVRAEKMGLDGRDYAISHFSQAQAVGEYLQAFKKVLPPNRLPA
jgi:colanic acid biosynthesis glycosyl transferase WcaI